MSFSNLQFLFYFLPLFFAAYYLLPFRFKNAGLVLGSALFYFLGAGAQDALLLGAVILLHYGLARLMAGRSRALCKALLAAALAADLLCLVYFKYAAFFLENWNGLTGQTIPLPRIALPLGVSFYLFQSMGYLIDVYRGEKPERNIIDYAAFTLAFPQLTMGPILRWRDWRGPLKERTVGRQDILDGLEYFIVGLSCKVLLADQLAPLWAAIERIGYEYLSTPLAWLGAVSYSLQLYLDFSGYSLMAMGLGQLLGLPVPRNFDLPYTARSVSEFYRRWHITLGTWFRDYLYIPLGGSRRGKARTLHRPVARGQLELCPVGRRAAGLHSVGEVLHRRLFEASQDPLPCLPAGGNSADLGHLPHYGSAGPGRVLFPAVPVFRDAGRRFRPGCSQAAGLLLVAPAGEHSSLPAAAPPLL